MLNSFFGLEMGKRALNAFRQGIDVAGHNIANVKTEGYSRQRVNLSTTDPYTDPGISSPVLPGQIGTGVKVDEIVRIRDEFLDLQYRSELNDLGYWSKINGLYETTQLYIAEPAGKGVRASFDAFWSSLQSLQKTPTSSAARSAVVESAKSLSVMVDSVAKGYDQYASQVNSEVKSLVEQVNTMLHEVAALNKEIYQVKALGQNPNDLLDKRDLILDKLTEMMDIDIQEPFKNGDVTGEFFITLNGRTLVQGDKVREVVAHAFQWEGNTYYDVQVTDNEFDIVEDCTVALALATGPEGVHQLNVDRLANGLEWTVGGADPYCLNENGTLKTSLVSKSFSGGIIATGAAGTPVSHDFTVTSGDYNVDLTLAWDGTKWALTGDSGSGPYFMDVSTDPDLTVQELVDGLQGVFTNTGAPAELSASVNGSSLIITSSADTVSFSGDTDFLGLQSRLVSMRLRPMTTDEGLGLLGSFRIQVGSQGTQVASKIFDAKSGLNAGDILTQGKAGDSYTFKVGANDYEANVTVTWNESGQAWEMTSDVFNPNGTSNTPLPAVYPAVSTGANLTVSDMTAFLKSVLPSSGDDSFAVATGNPATRFSITSNNNYLMTISDVKGDLAAQMGMVNTNPVITIDVAETDSLEVIRNKINEKYQEAYGLTSPEQWVHASLEQDSDQSWYLSIASDVAGEAQRITIMGDEDGNMQTLRRLGLVQLQQTGATAAGEPVYREITGYSKIAEDASFTFDGVRYLSADNKFSEARRVPSGTNRTDYSASKLETVSEGIWLELKGEGRTAITVRHHVKGGSIKALEEIRDGLIPDMKSELDEMIWSLVNNFNAYQYSGYGVGDSIDTTGVAFFNALGFKSGAASLLNVTDMVDNDISLIGAAMGKLDADGKAVSGVSGGEGDGSNAARMAGMKEDKLLDNGSASLSSFYESYLAKIGSEAGRAALMYKAQKNLTEQIDMQRQSVMGVNIDEEMLDILMFNQAFNAMSRYVTTVDEMLDRLINGFGLVGR